MPLLSIFKSNPDEIYGLRIPQIVALCGNGHIKDNSECSKELREYLSLARSESLYEYTEACLKEGFVNSGYILQDLINELGRRLDYRVENGNYQGRASMSGHDGIWHRPDGHGLVVEVKTSDAYRINLDTVAKYRQQLIRESRILERSSILIVVGRQDTGDLEAQVRGSKHAWDIRLISIDSLIKLVKLKQETEEDTGTKIHELLVPFEYTRLDQIIDIVFTAAKDAGAVAQQEVPPGVSDNNRHAEEEQGQEHTAPEIVNDLRQRIINAVSVKQNTPLIRKSAALYWDAGRSLRVACTISKRYPSGGHWYAYHPAWDKFLSEGVDAFFVLGCIGRDEAYAIPFQWIHAKLNDLYTTIRDDKKYWHIHIEEIPSGELVFHMGKLKSDLSLKEFLLPLR